MTGTPIRVLQTVEHRCGYFKDRLSRNLVVDPMAENQSIIYDALTHSGFRRAGDLIFRPHCRQCHACTATRVPIERFTPSRSQKRCLKRNSSLVVKKVNAVYSEEHFQLYRNYLDQQHSGGGMDNPKREEYEGFLLSSWSNCFFLEVRQDDGQLLAVAVCDQLSSGLSAVYTFYDVSWAKTGLGVFCILQQIELARQLKLSYLYLGYWIAEHPKMDYKKKFQPIEVFENGAWKNIHTLKP